MSTSSIPSCLQPISNHLSDPLVTEIMVNGANQVYIETKGKLTLSTASFNTEAELVLAIEEIAKIVGRKIDENTPLLDCRLPDGSRVNAVIRPINVAGPTLTIRKFSDQAWTAKTLIQNGTLTHDAVRFLQSAIVSKANILIAGGTGSGKTTLLGFLASHISSDERIITIEDVAELRLNQPHWVAQETRPAVSGLEEVTIRHLVKNALRMRPDRIIIGEVRGGESLDMLQAMNTGHDGSLCTVHANSARDALSRLETLTLFAGAELPIQAIRKQIASAIDLIVFTERMRDSSRRVTAITEVQGMQGDVFTLQDAFRFEALTDSQERVIGELKASGLPARF